MHFIDLLSYKRWHRVTARYDALRLPEDKREHSSLTNRSPPRLQKRTGTRQTHGAIAQVKTRETRSAAPAQARSYGCPANTGATALLTSLGSGFLFFLVFSRATPVAHGGSQARGLIGAGAAGLHQSHSNAGSEPCL